MSKFHDALQVREFFRTGRASVLPVNVTPELAKAAAQRIRELGFIPGDVTAECIINELDYVASERRAAAERAATDRAYREQFKVPPGGFGPTAWIGDDEERS